MASSVISALFTSPAAIFSLAFILRAALLVYGMHQDATSALKYTDIDYYVFTDAARSVSRGWSPYDRATYRYTPLLAWILVPTSWGGWWFEFGKALFALSDLVAGWVMVRILQRQGYDARTSLAYASVWLLNPMVANISTRGSSEGLLCALVMVLVYAFETGQIGMAGVLLGLAVHFKIYPFIYGRITLLATSLATFTLLNGVFYAIYGAEFLQHTFLHHLTRLDHRHNFSPYNMLLYLSSAGTIPSRRLFLLPLSTASIAFLPQLALSALLLPLLSAKPNPPSKSTVPSTLLAQTLAFVSFNKVCTSQYFLWYLVFLPLHLPRSSLIAVPGRGITALLLWVGAQAVWLWQGYELEFLGRSTT
ncbi:hypothetical protein DV737_g5134, partial [Chaetothyriales sp. CBS 132003]